MISPLSLCLFFLAHLAEVCHPAPREARSRRVHNDRRDGPTRIRESQPFHKAGAVFVGVYSHHSTAPTPHTIAAARQSRVFDALAEHHNVPLTNPSVDGAPSEPRDVIPVPQWGRPLEHFVPHFGDVAPLPELFDDADLPPSRKWESISARDKIMASAGPPRGHFCPIQCGHGDRRACRQASSASSNTASRYKAFRVRRDT